MWRSASSDQRRDHFVVIGNPGSRRIELFQAALNELRLPAARVVSYLDLLSGKVALPQSVRDGTVVRIESPGKDFEVERALIAAGADAADDDERFDRVSRRAAQDLSFERGRILYPRQWYLGYCATLRLIELQLAECPPPRWMNSPAEIALMFDKIACHQALGSRGAPVAPSLGAVGSFDELVERMKERNRRRVFVKLAYGSSASGVVAYQTDGRRHQATTTVETARQNGELRLYNSRRIRVYRDWREIAELIDALCRHRVHVEQWLPKAGFDNRTFDLRVVVIAGRACHTVARLSRSPMTNLHLLNERGDEEAVREKVGRAAWNAAMRNCELAMECFPGSLYAGIDLLFTPGYRRQVVIEVNAFGDLLPGVFWQGLETYAAELLLCI
jgi:glutathione synthase/RimK-type ligase-like ATP-grasp enzyme